jgi:DNA-binding NtrC family response regulator
MTVRERAPLGADDWNPRDDRPTPLGRLARTGNSNPWSPEATASASERILVVEDNSSLCAVLVEMLGAHGYCVFGSLDGEHALRTLRRVPIDLVMTDLMMPGLGGDELLKQVRQIYPEIPVIVMTSFGSVESAVAVTRAGAAEYLTKPLQTLLLLETVRRLLAETRSQRERRRAMRHSDGQADGIVGRSHPMLQLLQQIPRIAPSMATVLITGETGVGKELVARAVHRASGREPFVPLNCGAIPIHLLESELFGHVKGAFTGADRDHLGLFEVADGGTLFLDEIGEMPLVLQTKLLRVLQSGELRRVGDPQPRQVSVRVIAATHWDLARAVTAGTFREDLFYRIKVLTLEVPALRERTADIPFLAEQFLGTIAEREGQTLKRLTSAAVATLITYPWPGNVRELQNVIERTAIYADVHAIDVDDLPEEIRGSVPPNVVYERIGQELTLAELEREHILGVLQRVGGNRSRAAEVLGIPRRTLYRRLDEYGAIGRD